MIISVRLYERIHCIFNDRLNVLQFIMKFCITSMAMATLLLKSFVVQVCQKIGVGILQYLTIFTAVQYVYPWLKKQK